MVKMLVYGQDTAITILFYFCSNNDPVHSYLLSGVDSVQDCEDQEVFGGIVWDGSFSTIHHLLHSCLALPKFSYLIRTCSSTYISWATMEFNVVIRENFESILGGPLFEWSWLKATLPSSRGDINHHIASHHASAAFLGYSSCSQLLVG